MLPMGAYAAVDPVVQELMKPAEPFVWGAGGAKLTPEQVAALRAQGEGMAASDFSPVGHWTQGLGRALSNLEGGLKVKRAERMEGENRARDAELAEAMAGGRVDDATIARVLMDPNAGAGVREFAGMEYAARRPKASAPTELEKLMLAANIQRGSPEWNAQLTAELRNRRDPFTTFTGPTIGYVGPQSGLAAALGGGGQASVAQPGAEPPAVLPPDFDFEGGQAPAPDPFPVR